MLTVYNGGSSEVYIRRKRTTSLCGIQQDILCASKRMGSTIFHHMKSGSTLECFINVVR